MNKIALSLFCLVLTLALTTSGCSMPGGKSAAGRPAGTIMLAEGPENPTAEELAPLNRYLTNYLLYGSKALDATMAEYRQILDFHGADQAACIRDIINQRLSSVVLTTENAGNAFNYNSFALFEDYPLYVKTEAGTYERLQTVPILPNGEFASEELKTRIRNGLNELNASVTEHKNSLVTMYESLNSVQTTIFNNLQKFREVSTEVKNFLVKEFPQFTTTLMSVYWDLNAVVDQILNFAGPVGYVFEIAGTLLNLAFPSQEAQVLAVINEKIDLIFDYLDGIVDYLEVIDGNLGVIHDEIIRAGYEETQDLIASIRADLDTAINNLQSPGLPPEMKLTYATNLNERIDAVIINYMLYIDQTYRLYKEAVLLSPTPEGQADMFNLLKDATMSVELPITETAKWLAKTSSFDTNLKKNRALTFTDGGTTTGNTNIFEFDINIPSPEKRLPFDVSMLQYLHKILLLRFRINNLWQSDPAMLDAGNAFTAKHLLTYPSSMPLLKAKIEAAFDQMESDIVSIEKQFDDNQELMAFASVLARDWKFNAVETPLSGFSRFTYTPYRTEKLGGFNFQVPARDKTTGADVVVPIGYWGGTKNYSSIAPNQAALTNDNPYKFVICRGNMVYGYVVYDPDIPPVLARWYTDLNSAPAPAYPKYFSYGYSEVLPNYLFAYVADFIDAPKKLATEINHNAGAAKVILKRPDLAEETVLYTIENDKDIIANLKRAAVEAYKARASKFVSLLSEMIVIETDLRLFINDPANSSY